MPYLLSSRALLERFRAGDRAVLADVYQRYAPELVSYLRGTFSVEWGGEEVRVPGCATPFSLLDVVHEVFTRAFSGQARLTYDGLKPYGAYLTGIAHNVVVDQLRRRTFAEQAHDQVERHVAPGDSVSPQAALEEAEADRLFQQFLQTLQGLDRDVYEARFVGARGQEEAAKVLGLSRIQVRRSERRIRQRLLEHMKANGYLENFRFEGWGLTLERGPSPGKQRGAS